MIQKVAWTTMTISALLVGIYAAVILILPTFRPQFVINLFATAPTAISLHLGGGIVAIITGAFQLNSRLRSKYLSAHRCLGRLYVLAVIIGGIAGFVLALNSFGGIVTHFGFGLMAVFWVAATLNAYRKIRKGNVVEHRAWMLRSYALTLAGVTLRLYLGLSTVAGFAFSVSYPVISWLCWIPNLMIVEWFIRTKSYQRENA